MEAQLTKRYLEMLNGQLTQIDSEMDLLRLKRTKLKNLITMVTEGTDIPSDFTLTAQPSQPAVKRQTAPELILEVLRLANGQVLSIGQIKERIGDKANRSAIYQARSSLEKRGMIGREPGGWVLTAKARRLPSYE